MWLKRFWVKVRGLGCGVGVPLVEAELLGGELEEVVAVSVREVHQVQHTGNGRVYGLWFMVQGLNLEA